MQLIRNFQTFFVRLRWSKAKQAWFPIGNGKVLYGMFFRPYFKLHEIQLHLSLFAEKPIAKMGILRSLIIRCRFITFKQSLCLFVKIKQCRKFADKKIRGKLTFRSARSEKNKLKLWPNYPSRGWRKIICHFLSNKVIDELL